MQFNVLRGLPPEPAQQPPQPVAVKEEEVEEYLSEAPFEDELAERVEAQEGQEAAEEAGPAEEWPEEAGPAEEWPEEAVPEEAVAEEAVPEEGGPAEERQDGDATPPVAEWPTEDDGQGEEAPPAVEPAPMEEDDDEWVDWPPVEPATRHIDMAWCWCSHDQ